MIDRLKKRASELERVHAVGGLNWHLAVMPARLTAGEQAAWHAVQVEPLERMGGRVFVLGLVAGSERNEVWLQ